METMEELDPKNGQARTLATAVATGNAAPLLHGQDDHLDEEDADHGEVDALEPGEGMQTVLSPRPGPRISRASQVEESPALQATQQRYRPLQANQCARTAAGEFDEAQGAAQNAIHHHQYDVHDVIVPVEGAEQHQEDEDDAGYAKPGESSLWRFAPITGPEEQ